MTINFYKQNNVWIFRDVLTPPNSLMMKELANERVLIMDRARRTRYQGRVDNILDANGEPYEDFAALYAATEDFFNDFNEPAAIQLGIDPVAGSTTKYLSEAGTMEELPVPEPTGAIEVTYAELTALIAANELVAGQKYVISDYQTVHTIPNTTDTNTGDVEPLLVTAIAPNKLSPEAYSAAYPQDVIYYSPANDQVMVPGCTKGYIYRRVDTKQNNDIPFDFRQVKFRRWQISQPTWDAATTYSKGKVVKSTADNTLWVSLQDNNLNKAISDTAYWRQFEWDNLNYVSPTESEWHIVDDVFQVVLICTALYQDYKMWVNAADYNSAYSNKLEGNLNSIINKSNTVIFGSDFYNNSIGSNFYSNSIGSNVYNNSIGSYFYNNSIGSGLWSNTIGSDFSNNSIGSGFQSNSIWSNFSNNSIGSGFYNNSIGSGFYNNSIGSGFNYNSIGSNFSGKDLTVIAELYNNQYPHEIVNAASGYVITWYDATGTQQKTYTA